MTALPPSTSAVATSATEGDVKNWITGVHDYLSGLFGTTGVPADARTALGATSATKTSQLTNDSGFITSSGSCSSANSAGNGVVGFSTYFAYGCCGGSFHRITLSNGSYFDTHAT